MAAVVVSPRLTFATVQGKLAARYNGPGPLLATQWNDNSPLVTLLNIKNLRSNRFAKFPGIAGGKGVRTPVALAAEMHRYVSATKVPGLPHGYAKWIRNLENFVGAACGNPRAGHCARTTFGKHAKTGTLLYPYMVRDYSPSCAVSLVALFDLYRPKVAKVPPYSVANCAKMAKQVALVAAEQRVGVKLPGGKMVYPSAACPCMAQPLCAKQVGICNWVPPVVGAAPAAPWGGKGSCIPILLGGKTPFPGIQANEGQMFNLPAKVPLLTRAGSRYRKAPGGKRAWRSATVVPALARVPLRSIGPPNWP
jgi:hypothetical protein